MTKIRPINGIERCSDIRQSHAALCPIDACSASQSKSRSKTQRAATSSAPLTNARSVATRGLLMMRVCILVAFILIESTYAGNLRDSRSFFLSVSVSSDSTRRDTSFSTGVCNNETWWPLTTLPEAARDFPLPYNADAGIVISHCEQDLGWVQNEIARLRRCEHGGINVVSLHVYSKCGKRPRGLPRWAVVKRLPNVGRNDQVIATHLANENLRNLTIFLKDSYYANTRSEKERGFVDMCRFSNVALRNGIGLGCGMTPREWISQNSRYLTGSAWHSLMELGEFKMDSYKAFSQAGDNTSTNTQFQSPTRPLKNWLQASGVLPYSALEQKLTKQPLVPVCYGGQFAVRRENTQLVSREGWARFARALSRGDNVEEGHFAERSWGALLTSSPQWESWVQTQRKIRQRARIIHTYPLNGMLSGCGPPKHVLNVTGKSNINTQKKSDIDIH